jgi:hypothetical protein
MTSNTRPLTDDTVVRPPLDTDPYLARPGCGPIFRDAAPAPTRPRPMLRLLLDPPW